MKNNYYYVVLDLYKSAFKKESFSKSLGSEYKYFLTFIVLLLGSLSAMIVGIFKVNTLSIIAGTLVFLANIAMFYYAFVKNYSSLPYRKSRQIKVEKFNYFLTEYGFSDGEIVSLLDQIKFFMSENRSNKERRNDALFKWYVTISIGLFAFFGKEIWGILDFQNYVKTEISHIDLIKLVPVIITLLFSGLFFIVMVGLMIKSFYDEFIINRVTNEISVCQALEEVIFYRKGILFVKTITDINGNQILVEQISEDTEVSVNL